MLLLASIYSYLRPAIPAHRHSRPYIRDHGHQFIYMATYSCSSPNIRLCGAGLPSGIHPVTPPPPTETDHMLTTRRKEFHDEILMDVDNIPTGISYDIRLISASHILLDDETATWDTSNTELSTSSHFNQCIV